MKLSNHYVEGTTNYGHSITPDNALYYARPRKKFYLVKDLTTGKTEPIRSRTPEEAKQTANTLRIEKYQIVFIKESKPRDYVKNKDRLEEE